MLCTASIYILLRGGENDFPLNVKTSLSLLTPGKFKKVMVVYDSTDLVSKKLAEEIGKSDNVLLRDIPSNWFLSTSAYETDHENVLTLDEQAVANNCEAMLFIAGSENMVYIIEGISKIQRDVTNPVARLRPIVRTNLLTYTNGQWKKETFS